MDGEKGGTLINRSTYVVDVVRLVSGLVADVVVGATAGVAPDSVRVLVGAAVVAAAPNEGNDVFAGVGAPSVGWAVDVLLADGTENPENAGGAVEVAAGAAG